MSRAQLAAALLVPVLLITAVGVVYSKHRSRVLFVELQQLRRLQDQLDVDYGRLQLEQSAWATHGRVERIAGARLDMRSPAPEGVVVVHP